MLILQNNTENSSYDAHIEKIVEFLLDMFDKKSEIAIVITSATEIQQFNNDYRDKNTPTNVLSFPSGVPIEIADILGDIIICLEVVEIEAQEQSKTIKNHLTHMVIHGFLHLLGYDHINENDTQKMETLEIDVLQQLGIQNPYL